MPPSADAPFALSVDSGGSDLPVSGPSPRLSWKPSIAADEYELEATIDGVAQPPARSNSHRFFGWPWHALRSRQRVEWRVRVVHGVWSRWHQFEIGLLDDDWSSQWISPVEGASSTPGTRPAHALRTTFTFHSDLRRARLYSTALGLYEAFINGRRVGTAELTPGSTSYDQTVYAQAADVTDAIQPGENTLEIVLSDGWYRGQVGAFREPAGWGEQLAARAELHLDTADDETTVVGTGPEWTSSPSQITRAGLMGGQTTDFTFASSEAGPVIVDAVTAPPIAWSPAPPVRVIETTAPIALRRLPDGAVVIDFGQNASGWITLADLGPAGARTIIDYGEHTGPDGDLDTSHLDAVHPGKPPIPFHQRDEVISSGRKGEVFTPRHTIHGFRYARLRREGGDLTGLLAASVSMDIVHTALTRTAGLVTSDDDLNRLAGIADWSFRGNAVDVPTDCPTRERLGWTGDYQVFAPTAARLYDVLEFTRKWLRSVRDDQFDDGRIANFSPDGRRAKLNLESQTAMMTGSAGWGDAIVEVPWTMWSAYGDREILAENWDAMVRWVEWALGVARTRRHPSRSARSAEAAPHEEHLWDASFHWGEWLEPAQRAEDGTLINPMQADPAAWFMADKGEVATAFLHRSTRRLADIARILDLHDDADRYGTIAERVRDAWRTEYLNDSGRTETDSQASYVRALDFDLIPEQLRAAAATRLVELVESSGDHLTTGFLSTAKLLPVLTDTGHADAAYRVLFQRTAPSWLGMLDHGATTIWEDWDGVSEDGVARDSLNHYSKGAVANFLHTHVLGLRQAPGGVAWEQFVIAPVIGAGLTHARGWFDSPQGRIDAAWRIDGDDIEIELVVPPASRATIIFPGGEVVEAAQGSVHECRPLVSRESNNTRSRA
ncbi:alpha-L-rhamnosidase [Leifsonia sp. Leaf264]|uniref:family 78 glycoside hydrolase catalytic domain n=1 Tax=Leifsonia sp. Leaf264 TaxID=1736314 RepID=UPI0009E7FAC3